MNWQIIKQPDGKYCLYSSCCDSIIENNMTREEVIKEFVDAAVERTTANVVEILKNVDAGEAWKSYHAFAETFEDAIISTAVKLVTDNDFTIENLKSEYPIVKGDILKRIEDRLSDIERLREEDEAQYG